MHSAAVYSLANLCDPADADRFPALAEARPLRALVREGDVLYLPCGWWHAVRGSEGRNLSVNYWFALHESKAGARVEVDGIVARAAREGEQAEQHMPCDDRCDVSGITVASPTVTFDVAFLCARTAATSSC